MLTGRRLTLAAAVLGAIGALGASAVSAARPAASRVPVIVELFTSEGCESCPPADQILQQFISNQPVDTALVIGLSEHVDYWDRLGWKDPFSDAFYTRRQSDYAAHAGGDNIYTPQMIVDGGEPFVGSDRTRALDAIRKAVAQPKRLIALAWSTEQPGKLDINVPPGARQSGRVMMAITEDGLSTHVTRGENSGRTLTHDGVVRRLVELGKTDGTGAYHATVPVTFDAKHVRANTRVVVFIQQPGGPITAAGTIR